jgi:hypothetical protein
MSKDALSEVYDVKEKIGSGLSSIVMRATHKVTGEEVAVRVVEKKVLTERVRVHLKRVAVPSIPLDGLSHTQHFMLRSTCHCRLRTI